MSTINKKPTPKSSSKSGKVAKKHKYIFVVGGVMSGVGKGITTSSIGTILQAKGYNVNIIKVDPYLNVDAGTMNPTEHGEVFVLENGLETDQDMGNYERYINKTLPGVNYMTSGMIYKSVIEKERSLYYKGKCVEAIPQIRDEIIMKIESSAVNSGADISIIEIGGTVGDYQNIMFIEAARVLKLKHPNDIQFVMVTYLPIPSTIGEMKSKPTQNAVKQLQSYGVQADFLIARSTVPIDAKRKEKIAISCNVPMENVISAPDIDSIYDVPLNFERDKFGNMLERALRLRQRKIDLTDWRHFVKKSKDAKTAGKEVNIAVVGKYFDTGDFVLSDAYVSVIEAVKFSAYKLGANPKLHWLSAKQFEDTKLIGKNFKELNIKGVVVPGGFGETGIEGKINVIKYCRENKMPYFGLCYGMQLLVIEFARNVLGLKDANTSEINPKAEHLVIDIMEEQKKLLKEGKYGASMRLGNYVCKLAPKTIAFDAYEDAYKNKKTEHFDSKEKTVVERHRHRYEVNPNYIEKLIADGLVFSGTSPDMHLMEIAELPRSVHPFFLGTQFHPEFLARPLDPHPLFTEFIRAVL